MKLGNKNIIILLLVLLFIIVMLFFINATLYSPKSKPLPLLTPTPVQGDQTPPFVTPGFTVNTQPIPTIPFEQGGGINTNAPEVKNSEVEIQKLYPLLPYNQDIPLSTGITASVVIPGQDLQNNEWTLKVQIFGINYETSPQQSDYAVMKQSFKEAASDVFRWISNNGVNPAKIYFVWGDKAYIQRIAETWLSEQ